MNQDIARARVNRVAALLLTQGALECLVSVGWLARPLGLLYKGAMEPDFPSHGLDRWPPQLLVVASLLLASGLVKVAAAFQNLSYRNRRLGIVALWSAVLSLPTVWCAPSGIALLAYGLLVYRSREAAALFGEAAQPGDPGHPGE